MKVTLTKGFTAFIVIVNIIMSLLLFLSSQVVLIALNGHIVQGAGFFIDYGFPPSPIGQQPPTITAPLPNYPLFVFLFWLIVNIYFIFRLQRSKETKPNAS